MDKKPSIKEQTKQLKEKRLEAKKLPQNKAIILLTETATGSNDTLQEIQDKTDGEAKEFKLQVELILADLAEHFFDLKKYTDAILVDKKILKFNQENHLSYVRLYKSYCAIDQVDNGVIYGSMLKYKFPPEILSKYADIMPEIEKNMKEMAETYKNRSIWSEIFRKKMTFATKIKIFLFALSIAYLLYEWFNKKNRVQ